MKQELAVIYQEKDQKKKKLLQLRNRLFGFIIKGLIDGKNVREIHKEIYSKTRELPKIRLILDRFTDRAKKRVNSKASKSENAGLLFLFLVKNKYDTAVSKVVNHDLTDETENKKGQIIANFLEDSRDTGKYLYLASSHDDCAEDHKDYQGRLYVDANAPEDVKSFANQRHLKTIQWVMDGPAWFITRPNCRHYFVAIPLSVAKQHKVSELIEIYHTHSLVGKRRLATPRVVVVEEYVNRLDLIKTIYNIYQTPELKVKIKKIELLIKKHLKML